MALDHSRDFFTNAHFDPLNLEQTSPAFFLTRWITHICAPTFVFLAGTGAFLARTQGKTKAELSWFLFTRGLWLVVLELTYVNWFGWSFNINFHWFGIQVIWAIGWSMIALAGLIWLSRWSVLILGLVFIGLHNALDRFAPHGLGPGAILWRLLHAGGVFEIAPDVRFGVGYPLIPWFGVMATGYALGPLLVRDAKLRRRWLVILGTSLLFLFVVVRSINHDGDPSHWSQQKNFLFTAVLLRELHEVSAVPVFSFDDSRPGAVIARVVRSQNSGVAQAPARLRPRAVVLLSAAPAVDSCRFAVRFVRAFARGSDG